MPDWSGLVQSRVSRMTLMVSGFLALLILGSYLLPTRWRVEREQIIAAPPAAIFPYLNNLKKWPEWLVWHTAGPNQPNEFSGPEAGMGSTSRWNDGHQRGALKIMSSRNHSVEYLMILDSGDWELRGLISLKPVAGGTQVVWRTGGMAEADLSHRYRMWMERIEVEHDMERSLDKLRSVVESKAVPGSAAK